MRTRTLSLMLALCALCLLPAAASAANKTETASSGAVSVTLTYKTGTYALDVSDVRIAIARSGSTVFDQAVAEPCNQCAVVPAGLSSGGSSLTIRDLDGDGEPEVLFDIYTGGAHCCSYTWIYRYTGSTYSGTPATWGDAGYTLADLNGDGVPELRSFDDRFAYEFTDYADSAFPPAIWSYRAGTLTDVTRSFPAIVAADAKRDLRLYKRARHRRDMRGVVAAYVADQYLLGKKAKGLSFLKLANRRGDLNGFGHGDTWPRNGRYVRALKRFLAKNGYAG
jgi:hypothetical protein